MGLVLIGTERGRVSEKGRGREREIERGLNEGGCFRNARKKNEQTEPEE